MEKVVFLDRDGVINQQARPHEYITDWAEFEFLPGVPEAVARLSKAGYKLVIVTNQRGISRGMMTREQVDGLHRQMNRALGGRIDGIYVCPHGEGECNCRKPDIGLFLQAEQRFSVDKAQSWMIGDSDTDVLAGQRYGVKTILIAKEPHCGDVCCEDLSAAATYLIEKG